MMAAGSAQTDSHASVERVTVHRDGDGRRTREAARTGSGKPLLPDAKALLNIGRRSPRADIASVGWKCL
jgi:hypothetical protein